MFKFLIFSLLVGFLSCCQTSQHHNEVREWMTPNGKIKVLSTTAMIDDIVSRIGGERVDSHILIKGELDPHSYQLVKGDGEKLMFADIIFSNGLELEHGPSLRSYLAKEEKAIRLGNWIEERRPGQILFVDGQPDPHIWMDVSLWAQIVPIIVEVFSQHDPEHAGDYQKRGEGLALEMLKKHQKMREMMHTIPDEKRYLVTSHDAFNYFARAYLASDREKTIEEWKNRFEAPEGLAPESQISAINIQAIIDHMEKYRIRVLFPESNVSKDSIRKIVSAGKEKGLDLSISDTPLYGDAMGAPGSSGDTYLKMIQHNVDTLVKHLKE